MGSKAEMLSAGVAAGAADAIQGKVHIVALAGTNQATATQFTASNVVATSASASYGGRLPANPSPGDTVNFVNVSGQTAVVFPGTGGTINALSANGGISIANTKSCVFLAQSGTQWRTIPLVPS